MVGHKKKIYIYGCTKTGKKSGFRKELTQRSKIRLRNIVIIIIGKEKAVKRGKQFGKPKRILQLE